MTADESLKVAVVGCGNISRRHAEAYANTGRTSLVGVTDLVAAQAQAMADKYGSKPYAGVAELLAQEPDLVSVTTPPGSHAEIAIEILAARLLRTGLARHLGRRGRWSDARPRYPPD